MNTSFEKWLNRPVYKVQCYTFRRALELCNIKPPEGNQGFATRGGSIFDTFRALPPYRDQYAKTLRGMVATSIRMERFNNRHIKATK